MDVRPDLRLREDQRGVSDLTAEGTSSGAVRSEGLGSHADGAAVAGAWLAQEPAPSMFRSPRKFARWVRRRRAQTIDDNPFYRIAMRLAYVRRPRRVLPWISELLVSLLVTVVCVAVAWALQYRETKAPPVAPAAHLLITFGGVHALTMAIVSCVTWVRISSFISFADRAQAWTELHLAALREQDFMWGFVWAPALDRLRLIPVATLALAAGAIFAPDRTIWYGLGLPALADDSFLTALLCLLLGVSLALLSFWLSMLCVNLMGLVTSIGLAPSVLDPVELFFWILQCLPTVAASLLSLGALMTVVGGFVDSWEHFQVAIALALGGIASGYWGLWVFSQVLDAGLWPALMCRRNATNQVSWWKSTFMPAE